MIKLNLKKSPAHYSHGSRKIQNDKKWVQMSHSISTFIIFLKIHFDWRKRRCWLNSLCQNRHYFIEFINIIIWNEKIEIHIIDKRMARSFPTVFYVAQLMHRQLTIIHLHSTKTVVRYYTLGIINKNLSTLPHIKHTEKSAPSTSVRKYTSSTPFFVCQYYRCSFLHSVMNHISFLSLRLNC